MKNQKKMKRSKSTKQNIFEESSLLPLFRQQALEKCQIENALKLRELLVGIFIDFREVKNAAGTLCDGLYENMKVWEAKNPWSFAQYKEFGKNCARILNTVYKPYRLFPVSMKREALEAVEVVIHELDPFSASSLNAMNNEDAKKFEKTIGSAIRAIDELFPIK